MAITYEMIHETRVIPLDRDATTFTRPWTAALNLRPTVDMFEYACHEGNYAMRNMLSAARAAEQAQQPAR